MNQLLKYILRNAMDEINEEDDELEIGFLDRGDGGDDDIKLDLSTYELYYNKDKINKLSNEIINLYKHYFKMNLNFILNNFSNEYTSFEIITALRNIINGNVVIYNKYGFPSYLKESNNIYFLVDNLTVESNYYSEYYTQNPIVEVETPFQKIINDIFIKESPKIIKQLFKLKDEEKMKFIFYKLPADINELILENSIVADIKGVNINKLQRDLILKIFKNYYRRIDVDDNVVYISSLLEKTKKIFKCLEVDKIDEGWKPCNQEFIKGYRNSIKMEKERVKENIYGGYYGLTNENNFCIKSPE